MTRIDGRRLVPDPFGHDAGRLRLDLLHEVVAEIAAGRVGKGPGPLLGQVVGLDQRAFLLQDAGQAEAGDGRDRMVAPLLHETLQGRFVERGLLLAHGLVVAEAQPLDVGIQQGRFVLVVLMEAEQLLVQPDGLERGRIAVARSGSSRPTNSSIGRKMGLSAESSKASSDLAAACSPEL